jgi:Gnt-I system high-affinity gluconate transporter
MPLVILTLGIVLLFIFIVKCKINSFLSLILVSLIVGIAEGLPFLKVFSSIENGVGGTLGHLALVISFGAMLGKLMADSGGAQRIASTLIDKFGKKRVKWAVCLTGFIVGIAMFYEVGLVLLIPLVFTVAIQADIPLLEVGVPMVAALSVTHCFLPPHPGPTAIAVLYNADIGLTLIYGAIVAIPTVIIAGPAFYNTMRDLHPSVPEIFCNSHIFKDEEMPSFGVSIFTALVPVILMAIASITNLSCAHDSTLNIVMSFLGNPDMALFLAVFIAIYTFGLNRGKSITEVMKTIESAVLAVAMILLIVGGGGAFKQVLVDSGVGSYIAELIKGSALSPLVLTWLIATVIRVAVGSATVAALTTGGIMAPLIPLTGVSPELMVLATGAGSVNFGPPNDPGFWMFKEFFGLTIKETVRTWCVMECAIGVCGILGVLALNAILF